MSLRHLLLEVLVDGFEVACRCQPALLVADEQGEVFGHLTAFDRLNDRFLQTCCEFQERFIIVQLGAVREAPCPSED